MSGNFQSNVFLQWIIPKRLLIGIKDVTNSTSDCLKAFYLPNTEIGDGKVSEVAFVI